jgi:formylglycine-generating enzyme required for sulfatase activity/tRNA A-37 threonylcarbamoyl transferase component Bud32
MAPERIGKYEIEHKVGRGGFAVVYKARDPFLNRDVAIKVLHANLSDEPEMVERFYREARSAAALRHPHIVTIYEIGELDDGQIYLVMEYLPGLSLAEVLAEIKTFSVEQTLAILEQIADALDYAHGQNLVHRDVKPQNIRVQDKEDGTFDCVLTDFGLAKFLASEDLTTSGVIGTFGYMAPEQAAGRQDQIGPATDVYALGVMAYRMLTGRVPFEGDSASVLVAHLQDPPPDPRAICDALSPGVASVLLRSLAKDPLDRYPSAGEMVADLRQVAGLAGLDELAFAPHGSLWAGAGDVGPTELPEMIFVAEGFFWRGSEEGDPEAAANEKPRRQEYLPDYYVARYPVTNAQYMSFVRTMGSPAPVHWPGGEIPPGKEKHPVVNLDYQEAVDYCRWLSEMTGQRYRLPTEYEWEKAARGGEPETRRYPWGDDWAKGRCNSAEEGHGDTTAVDRYNAHNCSPYGVVDMVGNVWEWTDSLYRPYPGSNYYSTAHGSARYVVRGGSWRNGKEDARVSVRGRYKASTRRPYLGFRVVWEIR